MRDDHPATRPDPDREGRTIDDGARIDVVVPVYRGLRDTQRCIESVLAAACRTPFELVVVDDCSPEPALSAWLDAEADAGRIVLLRNESNRGFVGAVNRGMSLHPDRDVVLLNSDTEVANDWLDRLVACAASAPDIATVTPFSNNATIGSYPFEGWDGGIPGQLGLAALDDIFARTNAGQTAELPTGVGFCLLIRRACLDRVGLFDEERFGRGYGEECDFCMRASKQGWRNVLAADVFVYHAGAVSFGTERLERVVQAEAVMRELHPEYAIRVVEFIAKDPLRGLRDRVNSARAAHSHAEAIAVLNEAVSEREHRRRERPVAALREQVRSLTEACATLDAALGRAQGFVRAREADVASLQAERQALGERLSSAETQLAEMTDLVNVMRNSRTWRYSRRVLNLIGRK